MEALLRLIGNENAKIYLRLRTWVLLAIVFVAVLVVGSILRFSGNPAIDQVRSQLTAFSFATIAEQVQTLLLAFIVVIAGDIVASEFSSGTIKMLLTQPATRTRILFSKYIASLLYALFMVLCLFFFSLLLGGVFFGFHGVGHAVLLTDYHHHVHHLTAWTDLLLQYGLLFIQVIMILTIAFMISAIFRSSALAITISILAFLVGRSLVVALHDFTWDKFILFANVDFSQYLQPGGPVVHGMTVAFSVGMLVAYFIVMNLLSWWLFVKRDVALT